MMWYGVLGTKELLHRTYKNLEQKVLLEVSGSRRSGARLVSWGHYSLWTPAFWSLGGSPAAGRGLLSPGGGSLVEKDRLMPCVSLFFPCPAFPLLSVTGGPSHSPASRELQSSTFPATPEGPTSGGAPRKMMYVRVLGDMGPSLGRGGGNQRGSPFKERRPLRALTERQRSAGGALSVMQRDGRLPAGSGGTVENKTDGVPCSQEGGPGRTDVVRGTGVPQKPDPSCFGAIWEGFSEEGTSVLRPEDDLGLARSGGWVGAVPDRGCSG